jgi:hypothetical protein
VVRWLGAVQAQDFNAAKWALGLRMRKATDAGIEEAFNKERYFARMLCGRRGTSSRPEDIRWLLQLTAPRVNLRAGPNYRKFRTRCRSLQAIEQDFYEGVARRETSYTLGFEDVA